MFSGNHLNFTKGRQTEREFNQRNRGKNLSLGNNRKAWAKLSERFGLAFPNDSSADEWNAKECRIEEHKNFTGNTWGITPTYKEIATALYCKEHGIPYVFV